MKEELSEAGKKANLEHAINKLNSALNESERRLAEWKKVHNQMFRGEKWDEATMAIQRIWRERLKGDEYGRT